MAQISSFSNFSQNSAVVSVGLTVPVGTVYATISVSMNGGDNGETTLSSIDFGGVNAILDPVNLRSALGFRGVECGYMLASNMPSGAITVTATRVTSREDMGIIVNFFDSAAQAAPIPSINSLATGATTPYTSSVVMTGAGTVVDVITGDVSSLSWTVTEAGQTIQTGGYSNEFGTSYRTSTREVTSGSQDMTWNITTPVAPLIHILLGIPDAAAGDTTPDAFSFTDQTNVALSTVTESNTVTITGIDASTPISVDTGEYRINGGTYVTAAGNLVVNDTVQLRHTSSGSNSTLTSQTATIGGVADQFDVTTTAIGANIVSNTDPVIDGSTGNALVVDSFAGDITAVRIKSGAYTTEGLNLSGTGDNYTWDMPDVTAILVNTAGCPHTTASHQIVVEAEDT